MRFLFIASFDDFVGWGWMEEYGDDGDGDGEAFYVLDFSRYWADGGDCFFYWFICSLGLPSGFLWF